MINSFKNGFIFEFVSSDRVLSAPHSFFIQSQQQQPAIRLSPVTSHIALLYCDKTSKLCPVRLFQGIVRKISEHDSEIWQGIFIFDYWKRIWTELYQIASWLTQKETSNLN